jgi:predicted esterase
MHAVGYPVAASLAAARSRLFHWLDAEVGDAEVALLGFSDGAVTAFDLLLAEPGRFAASALFGGAIPWAVMDPPGAVLVGSPVLFSYGADDDVIGREPLERTARWLQEESGADVGVVVEPGLAHAVSSAQVARARALLDRVLPR